MLMKVKARKTAVWMQDNPQLFPPVEDSQRLEFLASFDKLFILSNFHKSLLPDWIPEDKIFLTTNGINLQDFNLTGIARNPKRLISISDYTRGIENLLTQWDRVLKEVPDVELHIFYGWQGVDALINSRYLERFPQLPDKKKQLYNFLSRKMSMNMAELDTKSWWNNYSNLEFWFILVILLWRFSVLVLGKCKLLVVFLW